MITSKIIEADNYWTEGFNLSLQSSLLVQIEEGVFSRVSDNEIITINYEGFQFEVESDPSFSVVYDIFLLEDGNPFINRTVWGGDNIPIYEGDLSILFTLSSFVIPSGVNDLSKINIEFMKVVKKK